MKEQPRPARIPELGSAQPLPAFAAELAPTAVREASEAFAEALNRLDEARRAAQEAADAVEKVAWEDRQAARDAAAARQQPPKAKVPEARERAQEAERAVPAAEWIAREALDRYLAAVREHRDEIAGAASEKQAALAAEARSRVEELEESLLRHREVGFLVAALDPPPAGRHPVFNVSPARRLGKDLAAPLDALRTRLGG
jgi:hypothetical protein